MPASASLTDPPPIETTSTPPRSANGRGQEAQQGRDPPVPAVDRGVVDEAGVDEDLADPQRRAAPERGDRGTEAVGARQAGAPTEVVGAPAPRLEHRQLGVGAVAQCGDRRGAHRVRLAVVVRQFDQQRADGGDVDEPERTRRGRRRASLPAGSVAEVDTRVEQLAPNASATGAGAVPAHPTSVRWASIAANPLPVATVRARRAIAGGCGQRADRTHAACSAMNARSSSSSSVSVTSTPPPTRPPSACHGRNRCNRVGVVDRGAQGREQVADAGGPGGGGGERARLP